MEYSFNVIEKKWQEKWKADQAYKVNNDSSKPKCYVLDMFPYPSGAGLHVGHPLGYIASDIFARYKRLKGFNVLHPMGYDAFGLPAEQYAIDHGIHPAVSTKQNIINFREQLDRIGFCFDWSREVNTADPGYYKWTQWIFLQLFNSWYDRRASRARPVADLLALFEKEGSASVSGYKSSVPSFTAGEWKLWTEKQRQDILMEFRLAYCGYGEVNWCEALGTVLANDEVINGYSERGGHPVVKKKLRQWYLRITDYADRLLEGLDQVAFSDAMKEMQSNWIGKSFGAEIDFPLEDNPSKKLRVYTTRPDTIFGVDFMVIAPEHDLIEDLATPAKKQDVDDYILHVKSRSERERMAEKKITGCFTGSYVLNPFNGRKIPVWISEYVLAGYGTGAIMAVPCGDERDFRFAQHFNIPVTNIIGKYFNGKEANPTKDAILENSDFLNGLLMRDAIPVVNKKLESLNIGCPRVNYKIRDAAFSRQRYWGEPFPIIWKDGIAYPIPDRDLPLELPKVDSYGPGPDGEGPLANLPEWTSKYRETNTMPGYAGSSWYFLRYMDPHNNDAFCSRSASDYWGQVDLYIGGTEHAVGHLLYSRMWTKFLFDLGLIGFDEPYRRLVNQGMIQGSSRLVYRIEINGSDEMEALAKQKPIFISAGLRNLPLSELQHSIKNALKESWGSGAENVEIISVSNLHTDVNLVNGLELDIQAFRAWRSEYAQARFVLENGKYICGAEVEKMSKSKFNTVNPNELVAKYGADTFRMYEMFLGPVEQSKPWDTKGIEGVHRFLRKLWRLFFDDLKGRIWTADKASDTEWKILHKAIKKLDEDTDRFSFNTAVSALMITVNELGEVKSHKKEILEKLLIILTPYAPHISEELWHELGNQNSILDAVYPKYEEKYLVESSKSYPVAINGKTRTELNISLDASQQQVEELVMADESIKKWLDGKAPKKVIYVKNKMINLVV
jgi:leucyl-tRNA synthetase